MAGDTLHIVPSSSGGWGLRKPGAMRATKLYPTQAEALTAGREIAQSQKMKLYVHGLDGRIVARTSYTDDRVSKKG